nr:MAG TPA: hypothetical protein [Caudoviricetes sp.]
MSPCATSRKNTSRHGASLSCEKAKLSKSVSMTKLKEWKIY